MIGLKNLHLRYGEKVIFGDVSLTIGVRDRIGLVGSNGAGKSTLLKLMLDEVEIDRGEFEKPDWVTLGYLPQDGIEVKGRSLFKEVETAFDDALDLQAKIEEADEKLAEMDTSSEEYYDMIDMIGGWEHKLEEYEPEKMKSKIERVLLGLGFAIEDMDRDTGEFSGGWQMRIALAKLLLRQPSLLLLDEPTNHLDIIAQNWFEDYLKRYEGSIMVISHDRAFLDAVTNRTLHLSLGNINSYKGNYSFYVKESQARLDALRKQKANQEKEIQRQKDFINRFRSNVKKASMVQSRIKALDKLEIIEMPKTEKKMFFRFPEPPPSSQKVIELINMSKSYGDLEVFNNFNFHIDKGDRIAVVGVNGAGKSTLARVLAGIEPFQSGERVVGLNTVLAYFAQQQAEELDPQKTALEEVEAAAADAGHEDANPRAVLGALLFRKDDVFKPTTVLSGGERNRLALAKILMKRANTIILDEPTNHLDMRSQDALQKALKEYTGAYLIVTHNRAFIDPIATKVLEVRKDGLSLFPGNVSDYLNHLDQLEAAHAQ